MKGRADDLWVNKTQSKLFWDSYCRESVCRNHCTADYQYDMFLCTMFNIYTYSVRTESFMQFRELDEMFLFLTSCHLMMPHDILFWLYNFIQFIQGLQVNSHHREHLLLSCIMFTSLYSEVGNLYHIYPVVRNIQIESKSNTEMSISTLCQTGEIHRVWVYYLLKRRTHSVLYEHHVHSLSQFWLQNALSWIGHFLCLDLWKDSCEMHVERFL